MCVLNKQTRSHITASVRNSTDNYLYRNVLLLLSPGMQNSTTTMICRSVLLSVGRFIASACCRHSATEERESENDRRFTRTHDSVASFRCWRVNFFGTPFITSIICFHSGSSQVQTEMKSTIDKRTKHPRELRKKRDCSSLENRKKEYRVFPPWPSKVSVSIPTPLNPDLHPVCFTPPAAESHLWPCRAEMTGVCWPLAGWETGGHVSGWCM